MFHTKLPFIRESFQKMKAAVRSGGSIIFKDNQPAPTSCGANQVMIEVKAAAINPVDYKENILLEIMNYVTLHQT